MSVSTEDHSSRNGCLGLLVLVVVLGFVCSKMDSGPSGTAAPQRLTDEEYNNVPLRDLPPEKRKQANERIAKEVRGDRP